MKKIYFSRIDKKYDPEKDIIIGPWCIDNIKENPIEPLFSKDTILEKHRELFNLSLKLVERDSLKYSKINRALFFKTNFKDYLYTVFFLNSLYERCKKVINNIKNENFCIETVSFFQNSSAYDYMTENSSAYYSYLIFKILINKNIPEFQKNIGTIKKNEPFFVKKEKKKIEKMKAHINYFSDISGVFFVKGFCLSVISYIRSFLNKPLINNDFYADVIKNDKKADIDEFISIYDKIFNNRCVKECSLYSIKKPRLIIKYANFLNNIQLGVIKDSNIVLCQHGACYSTIENHFRREIEYNFSKFITWGESHISYIKRDNIINHLPSPHLSSIADSYKYLNQNNILWITGCHYKCGDGIEYIDGADVILYINRKIDFYNFLEQSIKERITYKVLPHTDNQFKDPIRAFNPIKVVEGIPAVQLMYESKIVILDYYGTPFYEAMSMNSPIILVMLETDPFFTPEAASMFKKFEDVGVVYRDPKKAANFINAINEYNIMEWWNDKKIQTVRQEFIEKYANNKPYFWPWLKAISKGEFN